MLFRSGFETKPRRVFIVHGDDKVCDSYAEYLRDAFGFVTEAPYSGGSYDLLTDTCLEVGNTVRLEKTKALAKKRSTVYDRLVEAGQRLLAVIRRMEGRTNKELARFADQINALCEKWDD